MWKGENQMQDTACKSAMHRCKCIKLEPQRVSPWQKTSNIFQNLNTTSRISKTLAGWCFLPHNPLLTDLWRAGLFNLHFDCWLSKFVVPLRLEPTTCKSSCGHRALRASGSHCIRVFRRTFQSSFVRLVFKSRWVTQARTRSLKAALQPLGTLSRQVTLLLHHFVRALQS